MKQETEKEIIIWDDVVMMILALISGYLLMLEFTTNLTEVQILFDRIDIFIALIFLSEFIIKFFIAKSKLQFLKSNWWYLLASIPVSTPVVQASRLLRLLSLVRVIRLIRLVVGVREILDYIKLFVKQTHTLYVLVIWTTVLFFGSVSFYAFEHGINSNVKNLFDSLWYSMATITTVGYGDIYPITIGGRIVGMLLMICGIGMTGIFTALVASFFIKQK